MTTSYQERPILLLTTENKAPAATKTDRPYLPFQGRMFSRCSQLQTDRWSAVGGPRLATALVTSAGHMRSTVNDATQRASDTQVR